MKSPKIGLAFTFRACFFIERHFLANDRQRVWTPIKNAEKRKSIGHSIRAHKGKTGALAEKSANSGEGWGPSANCREGTGNFRATEAAIRRPSRSPRRPTGSSRHDGHSRRRGRRHFEPTKSLRSRHSREGGNPGLDSRFRGGDEKLASFDKMKPIEDV